MMGGVLLLDAEELTLLNDLLEACIVFENVFVEIACEYDLMISCLESFDKPNQVMAEVVAWVGILAFLTAECNFLLMK
jgi:hypothetical protein